MVPLRTYDPGPFLFLIPENAFLWGSKGLLLLHFYLQMLLLSQIILLVGAVTHSIDLFFLGYIGNWLCT
jgi:hypothetical protein